MGVITKFLKLLKPSENDYYNQQTEQADNWQKIDDWAEEIDNKTGFATKEKAGIIKIGDNLIITEDGKLSGNPAVDISGKLNIGNLPLHLQSAEKLLELTQANSGLLYDPNCLYIQEAKTKKEGYYYLDENQLGLWRCIAQTDINYNSATYFTAESIRGNADKLENLSKVGTSEIIYTSTSYTGSKLITLSKSLDNFKQIIIEASHERTGVSPQQFLLQVDTLQFNNSATTGEYANAYLIVTYAPNYGVLYFRSNKTQIYAWDVGSYVTKIYGIY